MLGALATLALLFLLHPHVRLTGIQRNVEKACCPVPRCEQNGKQVSRAKACEVLGFWFGEDHRKLFKELWFTREGSEERSRADLLVNSTFFCTVVDAEQGRLDTWKEDASSLAGLIIVLDQFSRHCYRSKEDSWKVQRNGIVAKELSQNLISKDWLGKLKYEERVFALMPLRHFPDPTSLEYLVEMTGRWRKEAEMDKDERSSEILLRFQRATRRQLDSMLDSLRFDGEILEFKGFDPMDTSQAPKHVVYRTIASFVNAYCCSGSVLVSLSGGVDSMVLCQCLCYIRDNADMLRRRPDSPEPCNNNSAFLRNVSAVHVNYGNRKESSEEAQFLQRWCETRNIHFHLQNVANLTRDNKAIDRLFVSRLFGVDNGLSESGAHGVMLGHHRGDVEENVISNVMKGNSVLNLAGMKEVQYMNQFGVQLQRPLLSLQKGDIYDFSAMFGVPFFKDTTPSWSTRGKLRGSGLCLRPSLAHFQATPAIRTICHRLGYSNPRPSAIDLILKKLRNMDQNEQGE
eukprot:755877-Hanusia_phi.AAC.3